MKTKPSPNVVYWSLANPTSWLRYSRLLGCVSGWYFSVLEASDRQQVSRNAREQYWDENCDRISSYVYNEFDLYNLISYLLCTYFSWITYKEERDAVTWSILSTSIVIGETIRSLAEYFGNWSQVLTLFFTDIRWQLKRARSRNESFFTSFCGKVCPYPACCVGQGYLLKDRAEWVSRLATLTVRQRVLWLTQNKWQMECIHTKNRTFAGHTVAMVT